jgi:hypothetical protein
MKMVHIMGGETFSHIRPHLALAAPAFGNTARAIYDLLYTRNGMREHILPSGHVLAAVMLDQTSSLHSSKTISILRSVQGIAR